MKNYISYSDLSSPNEEMVSFDRVGKVTSVSVCKHTGKGWKEWVGILNNAGAQSWTYQEIVAYLKKKYKLSLWWQQGVALGFEIAIGRRKTGQDAKGAYMVTATKSLSRGVQTIWALIMSKAGQKIWLRSPIEVVIKSKSQFETNDGYFGEIRTVARNRRVRLYWQDPAWEKHTIVELQLVPKPGKKSLLIFNHTGIKNAKTQALLRARWKEVVEAIASLIE